MIAPCRDCGDRYPGCSDRCEKESFKAWKEQEKRRKEAIKEKRFLDAITAETQIRAKCHATGRMKSQRGYSRPKRKKGQP